MIKENLWKRIYREGHLSESSDWGEWKQQLFRSRHDNRFLWQFFALARYEAKTAEPLTSKNVDDIAKRTFDFAYAFTGHGTELQQQLDLFGVGLVHATNGFQYLRALHRLSGVLYLKVVRRIRQDRIPYTKWFNGNSLSDDLQREISSYVTSNDDPTEDVVEFLRRMKERYERHYQIPTAEQCVREENSISPPMVKRILTELGWAGNADGHGGDQNTEKISAIDTVPQLLMDEGTRLVVGFPQGKIAFNNVDKNASIICFDFKDANDDVVFNARFHRVDNEWKAQLDRKIVNGIPVDAFSFIKKSVWNRARECIEQTDVTPTVLRDPNADHILFQVEGSDFLHTKRLYEVGDTIPSGTLFFVTPLNDVTPRVVVQSGDKEVSEIAVGKPFHIPANADVLLVGSSEYPIRTKASEWIDMSCCRWTGARLFCEKSQFPFSDDLVSASDVEVFYRKTDSEEVKLPVRIGKWDVAAAILWNKGWLVFRGNDGRELTKRALTFIPDIDDSSIDHVFPLDKSTNAIIKFGDESVDVTIQPLISKVQVDVHGFTGFNFPLKRKGVFSRVPGTDAAIPLSTDKWNNTEIATADFEAATFYFVSDCQNDVVVHGEKIKSVKHGKLSGLEMKSLVGEPYDGNWSIRDGAEEVFFHIYDPVRTPADEECQHPVRWWRQGDDLIVRFWSAHRWRGKNLTFIFYPAHRQDSVPVIWKETDSDFETADHGRLFTTAAVRGLYGDDSEIEWGCGLLAFVGFDKGNGKFQSVSSGFFVKAEDAETFQISNEDDPYGLRLAMARCDIPSIENIMQTEDVKARAWIREYENRTLRALNQIGALEYFHAYRSHCIDAKGVEQISGYFFMAGWFLIEKMGALYDANDENSCFFKIVENEMIRKGKLPEDYNGKWSSLLIADKFFPKEFLTLQQNQANEALSNRDELTHNETGKQRYWTSSRTFNDTQIRPLIPRLLKLIAEVKQEFPFHDFNPHLADATFVDFGGDFDGMNGALILEECVSRLAKWVAEWRKNPSLEGAQRLRDFLLEVQSIDNEIAGRLYGKDDDHKEWLPKYSIHERIAFKADYFRSL